LNGTTAQKELLDLRGNASGVTENGVKQSTADQIGNVLTLDGIDDFIEVKNFEDPCVVDPSFCREGLSVAFWIKYNAGESFFFFTFGYFLLSISGHTHEFMRCVDERERIFWQFIIVGNKLTSVLLLIMNFVLTLSK